MQRRVWHFLTEQECLVLTANFWVVIVPLLVPNETNKPNTKQKRNAHVSEYMYSYVFI